MDERVVLAGREAREGGGNEQAGLGHAPRGAAGKAFLQALARGRGLLESRVFGVDGVNEAAKHN
jgi:hypothetical protein